MQVPEPVLEQESEPPVKEVAKEIKTFFNNSSDNDKIIFDEIEIKVFKQKMILERNDDFLRDVDIMINV